MTRTHCERCGQCCLNGGPALHGRDRKLIEDGTIERMHLLTYLKGELLRDPITDTIMPIAEEIVKLKTAPGSQACVFFIRESNTCSIYAHRPVECRAQKCWDPEKLLAMYEQDRLQRSHLVAESGAMADLISEHGERCDRKRMQQLARRVDQDESARSELVEMLTFDEAMRDLVAEKAAIPRDMLDFYFGRPVALILPTFGIRLTRQGKGYAIKHVQVHEQEGES